MEENKYIILDASVVFGFFFQDEYTPYVDQVWTYLQERSGLVSSIFPIEVANALKMGIKRKRWSSETAWEFLTSLYRIPIDVETNVSNDPMESLEYAEKYNLTGYDASYLALAVYRKLPLATQDEDLRKAAKKCGVLWEPA